MPRGHSALGESLGLKSEKAQEGGQTAQYSGNISIFAHRFFLLLVEGAPTSLLVGAGVTLFVRNAIIYILLNTKIHR